MDIRDFMSTQEVEYTLSVHIEGEKVGQITALSLESLQEQMRKIEHIVATTLENNYYDWRAEEADQVEVS